MRENGYKLFGLICLIISVYLLIYGLYLTDRFVSSPLRFLMIAGGALMLAVGTAAYKIIKKD